MVEPEHAGLSITKQCNLLQISRSSWYYEARGESELNLALMRLIDEQFLDTPYYGARQMARHLCEQGYQVNRKQAHQLMQKMGLAAIYQKPNTSNPDPDHKIFIWLKKWTCRRLTRSGAPM
ncbi:MAG: IS3 family transposase [Dissulfurispiraceae bacterium]